MEHVTHSFGPWYWKDSKILILGSMPSRKSRELNYYYAHPKNRFWKVLEVLFEEKISNPKEFCQKHKIALWDTLFSCDIHSSSDSSIQNIVPNDLSIIFKKASIQSIFTTGKKAHEIYQKYLYPIYLKEDIMLPSTSPANASYSLNRLVEEYKIIKKYLE